jgi:hypothetical protein
MNCFVIMPFADEFDDVYATIKNAFQSALGSSGGRCFRLTIFARRGGLRNVF